MIKRNRNPTYTVEDLSKYLDIIEQVKCEIEINQDNQKLLSKINAFYNTYPLSISENLKSRNFLETTLCLYQRCEEKNILPTRKQSTNSSESFAKRIMTGIEDVVESFGYKL